ncbi:U3 small nucleolar RNA-associated protein 6 [Gracilariopsis chorda]|uniref:U3 small nucleolar RNA-associated protein 6 n=1 Tax=Gracilariopsis chorda TaxID=448386 RepID=A0A2V3IZB6_9FLOR|nr:U3 small nucleolar RNA-associated protein 6 [Gracilariopsis chorda]|eukprot:PXF47481.1 U3 small nucleolar RNA-associated protein 6 [Gracilariopsis chorda]
MGDNVERELRPTIPVLHAAQKAKILNRWEVNEVVRKRRHHEYNLLRRDVSRSDFLHYAAFERELASVLRNRAKKRQLTKIQVERTVNKTAARVNLIYSRAVSKFRFDDDLWLHYAKHCVRMGATRAAARVFAKAIAYRNDSDRIWLAAISFHFDVCADTTGARTIAQRALRALPNSVTLWKEYFRLELCYLGKLVARRLTLGLSPLPKDPNAKEGDGLNEISQNQNPNESKTANIPGLTLGQGDTSIRQEPEDDRTPSVSNSEHETEKGSDQQATNGNGNGLQNEEETLNHPSDSQDSNQHLSKEIEQLPEPQGSSLDADKHETPNADSIEEGESSESDGASSDSDESQSESEDLEQNDGSVKSSGIDKLSFWEGGVPFAIFRSACDRISCSHKVRAEFWDIAASIPFVPPMLLSSMFRYLKEKFSGCKVVQVIAIRQPWDTQRAERRRSLGSKLGEEQREINFGPTDRAMLLEHAQKVADQMYAALRTEKFSNLSESENEGIRAVLSSFRRTVFYTGRTDKSKLAMQKLMSSLDGMENEAHGKSTEEGEKSSKNGKDWSTSLMRTELKSVEEPFSASTEFVEALKQKVVVPFRNIEQDGLVCLYLSKETDILKIRNFVTAVLAVPPITMESLQAAINAELRIYGLSKSKAAIPSHQKDEFMLHHTRQLFKKAVSLAAARRDVELWLSYIDFERHISGDMREASAVSWKASKVLMPNYRDLFTERQALRSLG